MTHFLQYFIQPHSQNHHPAEIHPLTEQPPIKMNFTIKIFSPEILDEFPFASAYGKTQIGRRLKRTETHPTPLFKSPPS